MITIWTLLLPMYFFGAFICAMVFSFKQNDVIVTMAVLWPILAILGLMACAVMVFRWAKKLKLRNTYSEVKAEVLDWFAE